MKSLCIFLFHFSALTAFSQIQFIDSNMQDVIASNNITKEYNSTLEMESKEGEGSNLIIQ